MICSNLLVLNILVQQLQLLPQLGVLLLPHELHQLPLGLQLLLHRAEISNFLLSPVLKFLQMFAGVLLGLKSNKNLNLAPRHRLTDRQAQLFLTFIAQIIYQEYFTDFYFKLLLRIHYLYFLLGLSILL